ncbi:unnamed protein product [Urochloa humidicola]
MGRKWNAEARITALLFSFSAAAFFLLARAALLQPHRRGGGGTLADALLAAIDRLHLDGRGLLHLATRRNMVLLCHAILLLILRDAGVLGTPARRRATTTGCAATSVVAAFADAERGVVVRRRPRQNRAAAVPDPDCQVPSEAAATWAAAAAPAVAQAEEPAATKQMVLVEQATARNHLVGHDRAPAVELEQLQVLAATSATKDCKKSEFDRRAIVVADDDDRNASTVAEQTEEVELADDRRIEEFIARQWSNIRQESLQLVIRPSSG